MESPELVEGSYRKEKAEISEGPETNSLGHRDAFEKIPILIIALTELMIYAGNVQGAVWAHVMLLTTLVICGALVGDHELQRTYQILMLLPVLRLVNLSMPLFFDMTLYSFIFTYAPLSIPVAIIAFSQKFTKEEVGLTSKNTPVYALLGLLVSIPLGMGEYFIIRPDYLIPDLSFLNLLQLIIVMVFFVGLVEEIIFRSLLQTRLEKVFGTWQGLLVTSLLFGLMHSGYGTFYEILYVSFVGLTIGYIFQKTKSLFLITIVHGFVNVFLFGIIPHVGMGLDFF